MLQGQHGGGHQHGHLLIISTSLHSRTHGYLGLTKTHIATYEAVHRFGTLHVAFHLLRYAELVGRIFIYEAGFQLMLHKGVGTESKALFFLSL